MSERKTLLDKWKEVPRRMDYEEECDEVIDLTSAELEAIRALYDARVAYLENQNEIIQTRLAVLEARCQSSR